MRKIKYNLIGGNNYRADDIFGEILKNRNIDDIDNFFNFDDIKLPKYDDFINMKLAAETIIKHVDNDSHIVIIEDSDPDGLTSTSIIYQYIKYINPNSKIKIIVHKERVHGIFLKELHDILRKTDLIIAPDCGSENYYEHKVLKKRYGIDVVVIDHHKVKYRSVNAIVVNNNIDNKYSNLSGAGMTYLLCKALDDILWEDKADEYMDLVALGMISDMMKINQPYMQYFIQEGMSKIKNKGFQALIDQQSYSINGEITPNNISFYITPLINAVFRLGDYEDRINLTKAFCGLNYDKTFIYKPTRGSNKGKEIEERIYDMMARKCVSLNNKRKRLDEKIMSSIEVDDSNKIIVAKLDEEFGHQGMTRTVVNSLSNKYKKPSIVYYVSRNNLLKGSMASGGYVDDFKDKLIETGVFDFVAGHVDASGLQINKRYINQINDILNTCFKDYTFERIINVDFIIPGEEFADVGEAIINELNDYKLYYGKGLEEPRIVIENLVCDTNDISLSKSKNTIMIKQGNITFIKFKSTEEKYHEIVDWNEKINITIIGKCSINEYQNERYPQVIIDSFIINDVIDNDISEDDYDLDGWD